MESVFPADGVCVRATLRELLHPVDMTGITEKKFAQRLVNGIRRVIVRSLPPGAPCTQEVGFRSTGTTGPNPTLEIRAACTVFPVLRVSPPVV